IRMLDQPYMTDLIEANSMGHEPHKIHIYSASWGPTDDGRTGRNGLGNIYVWASGDGGEDDDCNCDGYAASMWTVSINSAINDGQNAHYDESCSSTLASTFSNGARDPSTGVATTDLYGKCTATHSGTSAAAPEAAGVFALALHANEIPSEGLLTLKIETTACAGTPSEVRYLEHVQAVKCITTRHRSMILSRRANDDDSRDGFTKWPFMTTHTWGEYPQGTWVLEPQDPHSKLAVVKKAHEDNAIN
ncbi:hypothetical protein HF086_001013, partial [Spodoptera exigua]